MSAYENPQIPEGINVSPTHPLKDFALLLGGVSALIVAGILLGRRRIGPRRRTALGAGRGLEDGNDRGGRGVAQPLGLERVEHEQHRDADGHGLREDEPQAAHNVGLEGRRSRTHRPGP